MTITRWLVAGVVLGWGGCELASHPPDASAESTDGGAKEDLAVAKPNPDIVPDLAPEWEVEASPEVEPGTLVWSAPITGEGYANPTVGLDGLTLYYGSHTGGGILYPWPKYKHDLRNTSNVVSAIR